VVELRQEPLVPAAQRAVHLDQLVRPITQQEDLFFLVGEHTEQYPNNWLGSVQLEKLFTTDVGEAVESPVQADPLKRVGPVHME
jgi:hypothetical protein